MDYISVPDSGGFVLIDLPDAPQAAGVVRWARKILKDGAAGLARSMTYSFAALELQVSGASAGISADAKVRDESVAAFANNLPGALGDRSVLLDAAKGVAEADLAPLRASDTRDPRYFDPDVAGMLADEGVLASAAWAHGPLAGARVTIDGAGEPELRLARAAIAVGATVVALGNHHLADGFDEAALSTLAGSTDDATDAPPGEVVDDGLHVEADVALVGAKSNSVDHRRMEQIVAAVVVPYGRLAVTTRALAVAARAHRRVLPDFVTVAGPLVAAWPAENSDTDSLRDEARSRVVSVLDGLPGGDDGLVLEACVAAEAYLSTWRDELPFGRPI